MSLKSQLKEKFDYDVSSLDAWTDSTMPEMIPDLIENSTFLSRMTLETGIKGTKDIELLNADVELQAKTGCSASPDGSVVFTNTPLTTHLMYMGIEFCNETLNGKITQVMNKLGVKMQNGQLPADLESILMAYLGKQLQRKAQKLVILGDETSLNTELAIMDGLVVILDADTSVVEVDYQLESPSTGIDATNGYDIAYAMATSIDTELLDSGMRVEVFTGRKEALAVLKNWNDTNPYSQVAIPTDTGSIEFDIPLTGVRMVTLPELNGLDKMYAIPMDLTFLGTDEFSDMEYAIKYDEYNDKLKAECSFRLGTNIVWGKYFTRLDLTAFVPPVEE